MTVRSRTAIRRLYYFHRYTKASIGRLMGLSHVRIHKIVIEEKIMVLNPDLECLMCGNENAKSYYIDGDPNNENPQNRIMLCDYDANLIKHLQMRKRKGVVTLEV